ncbi:MAG: hypothetical protein H0W72_13920, partial [Planctomycetes bacterium]|nr:hypothetical protein [Planctomycetota bacterium]
MASVMDVFAVQDAARRSSRRLVAVCLIGMAILAVGAGAAAVGALRYMAWSKPSFAPGAGAHWWAFAIGTVAGAAGIAWGSMREVAR